MKIERINSILLLQLWKASSSTRSEHGGCQRSKCSPWLSAPVAVLESCGPQVRALRRQRSLALWITLPLSDGNIQAAYPEWLKAEMLLWEPRRCRFDWGGSRNQHLSFLGMCSENSAIPYKSDEIPQAHPSVSSPGITAAIAGHIKDPSKAVSCL